MIGAIAAKMAAPERQVVSTSGDGAFQMTGMELSTIVRRGLNPIVILLDNLGYGTERVLHPGNHGFNDVHPWQYHNLPEVLGKGRGYDVRMEADFDAALQTALDDDSQMHLLHVHIDLDDRSATLDRLAEKMSGRV